MPHTVIPKPHRRRNAAARPTGRAALATGQSLHVRPAVVPSPLVSDTGFQPDPYVDYGRFLTAEGGILVIYKDIDDRFRHTLWRVFAWTASTGLEAWFLLYHSPVRELWINIVCLLAMAAINWLIVMKPVELYRRIEIRPDSMIIDGADVFWLRLMEAGLPGFQPGPDGLVLSGIYGNRFVEYLTVRRFDEFDRSPEVFSAHLQDAMWQLWALPGQQAPKARY